MARKKKQPDTSVESFLDSKGITDPAPTDDEIVKQIDAETELEYLIALGKKNKEFLVKGLTAFEKERIAEYIISRYEDALPEHSRRCDEIDKWDEVYRMKRAEVIGSSGDTPNYRTPLTTGTIETVHANEMNVFFTPKDTVRVIPTEESDIPKVQKMGTFANWSAKNELKLFERCDRMWHYSKKAGECPYIVHWVKTYGTEIKRNMIYNPANPEEPLFDPDTKEPLFQEVEEQKLLYNAPKLEVFSRKDYIQPKNALMDILPEFEMVRTRMSYDDYLRDQLQGKMYDGSIDEISDWGGVDEQKIKDYDGKEIPVGQWNNLFLRVYIRMRINLIKDDKASEVDEYEELEDEFIAIVHVGSRTLCSLRKNKFPLKKRPVGVDFFIPDDSGRRRGIGVCEFMDSLQKSYDALYNQYIEGTIRSNDPAGFYSPLMNKRDSPIKIKNGFLHQLPAMGDGGIQFLQVPQPNSSLERILELIRFWAQFLFGISEYTAGMESTIDPSAPAKKAEIAVSQGNVRLNLIIRRKNTTLKDIFERWYLLYKDNMPENKFMRVAGAGPDDWKFEKINLQDFELNAIPDFELTGNVLNANKEFEVMKKIAIYDRFLVNPLFSPQLGNQGMMRLIELTRWLIDGIDEIGLGGFLPKSPGEMVQTPEEENARFVQGESAEPLPNEDHIYHINKHRELLLSPTIPDEIKKLVIDHINKHVSILKAVITQQIMFAQHGPEAMGLTQPNGEQFNGGGNGGNGQPAESINGQGETLNRVF